MKKFLLIIIIKCTLIPLNFVPSGLIIFFITNSSINLFAQQPTEEWVRTIQGPANESFGPFLAVDKKGNSYVAGTHVINDSINILCVKYNTSGIQQWYTLYKYPGEGYFSPRGLALDSSGNAYVISSYGQGYLLPLNGLIVKFNSLNGNPVWAKRYVGEYGWSTFSDIKIDRMNNIYIAGGTDTSHLVIRYNTNGDSVWIRKYRPQYCGEGARALTLDDSLNIIFTGLRRHNNPPYGHFDSLLVAKYSPGGVLRWESVYAYSYIGANVGEKITADQNGNTYIGGVTNIAGDAIYLTLKYDRNGVRQWTKIYDAPGNGDNTLYGIAIDRINNSLYVTGIAKTNDVQMATTIKYNPVTGDSLWVRRDTGTYKYGGSRDIILDTSGNIYITGATHNIPPGSAVDILTIKYSPQGNRMWIITFNGPFNGGDGGYFLKLDNLNNIYILGASQSSSQLYDNIVIKYSQLVGVHLVSNEIPLVFKLGQNHPNPFNPITTIKYAIPTNENVTLKIYDILGRLVTTLVNEFKKAGYYDVKFDGTNYASGVYFYRIDAGKYAGSKKMILVK